MHMFRADLMALLITNHRQTVVMLVNGDAPSLHILVVGP